MTLLFCSQFCSFSPFWFAKRHHFWLPFSCLYLMQNERPVWTFLYIFRPRSSKSSWGFIGRIQPARLCRQAIRGENNPNCYLVTSSSVDLAAVPTTTAATAAAAGGIMTVQIQWGLCPKHLLAQSLRSVGKLNLWAPGAVCVFLSLSLSPSLPLLHSLSLSLFLSVYLSAPLYFAKPRTIFLYFSCGANFFLFISPAFMQLICMRKQ